MREHFGKYPATSNHHFINLEKDNFVTIHRRNLQTLAIEIFKGHKSIATEIMKVYSKLIISNIIVEEIHVLTQSHT